MSKFKIQEDLSAPNLSELLLVSKNKSNLLCYVCNKFCSDKITNPKLHNISLILGGGFETETKTVIIRHGSVEPVLELESTHEEADT